MSDCCIKTKLWNFRILEKNGKLYSMYFTNEHKEKKPDTPVLKEAAKQVNEYFNGTRKKFSLPLLLEGTEFQKGIWTEMMKVKFGETIPYSELARRAGKPRAVRAAANACGRNPMGLIIPCHRIVAKNGIGGFTGDINIKKKLLDFENAEY